MPLRVRGMVAHHCSTELMHSADRDAHSYVSHTSAYKLSRMDVCISSTKTKRALRKL